LKKQNVAPVSDGWDESGNYNVWIDSSAVATVKIRLMQSVIDFDGQEVKKGIIATPWGKYNFYLSTELEQELLPILGDCVARIKYMGNRRTAAGDKFKRVLVKFRTPMENEDIF